MINNNQHFQAFNKIERLRNELLKDQTLLQIQDWGAGSIVNSSTQKTIESIAKASASPKKYGQLLFRMVNYYQPDTILELGTSLGISTAYLAGGNPKAKIVTMEGASSVAAYAEQNFRSLELKNMELISGNFDDTLPSVVNKLPSIDFAFMDGNHRQEPTERYFKTILQKTHNNSIIVLDDIHWSREMHKAWETIKNHPAVRCTIDLFFVGIVFLREEFKEKQHFVIRF